MDTEARETTEMEAEAPWLAPKAPQCPHMVETAEQMKAATAAIA